jgi:acyl-CoA reductase-like NAD-dependent aldehyde dehydrogenase
MPPIIDGQIHCTDPRTGEQSGTIACTPVAEISAIVDRAKAAQHDWFDRPLKQRKVAVANLQNAFLEQAEQVAETLAKECGRPAGEAWTAEIVANHELFGFWLQSINDLLTATPIELNPINYPGKRGHVRLDPKGLIGLITPWNLPVAIPLRTIIPAILAGNAVIWKPSEHAPQTAALLAALFDAHLVPGLVGCIQGGGEQGQAVIDSGVDTIFFTGSVRTGRAVQQQAAQRGTPVSLELGGKDAAVVLADTNFDRTVEGVTWAAFGFAGQNCAAIERCYVHTDIYDKFVAAVVERTKALRPLTDIGPLVTKAQLDIVNKQLANAIDGGATLQCGGSSEGPGFYHPPTVLTDLASDADVLHQETFGPLLPIVPFDDLDDVVKQVNSTSFGLTTSVWTRNTDFGEALADRFECGVVTINNHSFTGALASAAWGGTKDSGHGVTNSRFALYEMTRPRTILIDRSGQREMWWYPYNNALLKVTGGLVDLSRNRKNRLAALGQLLSGLLSRWKESK